MMTTICPTTNVVAALWPQFPVTKLVIFQYHVPIYLFRGRMSKGYALLRRHSAVRWVTHRCSRKGHYGCAAVFLLLVTAGFNPARRSRAPQLTVSFHGVVKQQGKSKVYSPRRGFRIQWWPFHLSQSEEMYLYVVYGYLTAAIILVWQASIKGH